MIKTTTCIVMSAPFALGSSAAAVCVGVGFIRSLRTSRETRSLVDSTPRGWALLYQYTHLKIVEKSKLSCDLFFTNRSLKPNTTLNNGYLGSRNDEERSEMRYVVRIAGCMRVIESLNAYCARGFGREHVCLSVTDIFQLPPFWWGVRT